MRHENTVFHGLTKHLPWSVFDRFVEEHRTDHRVRRLDTKSQFLAMLYGQLTGSVSLREIEAGLASHSARLYHLGAKPAARSTLADANANRSWKVFGKLFSHMAAKASRSTRRSMADAVRILDATHIRLSDLSKDWALCRNQSSVVKLHLVLDGCEETPLNAKVTPDTVGDITVGRTITIEPGATYVFDLAYYDYGWWAKMHAERCRFVSRLKTNTRLTQVEQRTVREGTNIKSDCIGLLPQRMARSRQNPFSDPVREITVTLETGKTIRIVSNDLDAPAEEIADLYKQRWKIELFFKWIKQNLKIKRFLGTSENAVRIQIFVALITYLLLRIVHGSQKAVKQLITFTRLIKSNLMHRRNINQLQKPKEPIPIIQKQMRLELEKC